MTGIKFDALVTARAGERVDAKIMAFKDACWSAAKKLTGREAYTTGDYRANAMARKVFTIIAGESHNKNWPLELWSEEEEKVRKELLAVMDEMQKAFVALDNPVKGENEQEEAL